MKIQCRLDYFFISKQQKDHVKDCKILPTIYSDHSAVALSMSFNESELPRGPGFWKFNNSLLSDTNYVELLTFKIPMFAKVNDKGLYLVSFAAVIRVVTQRSSPLTAAHERETFLSLKLTSKKQASIFWKPGPNPSPLLESKHGLIYLLLFQKSVNNSSLAS